MGSSIAVHRDAPAMLATPMGIRACAPALRRLPRPSAISSRTTVRTCLVDLASRIAEPAAQPTGDQSGTPSRARCRPHGTSDVDLQAAYESATQMPLDGLVQCAAPPGRLAPTRSVMLAPHCYDVVGWSTRTPRTSAPARIPRPGLASHEVRLEAEEFGRRVCHEDALADPLVRWPSGHLTVIDPELILDRGCGVWPLYDILRELEAREESAHARRVRGAYDHVMRDLHAGDLGRASWVMRRGRASTPISNYAHRSGASA